MNIIQLLLKEQAQEFHNTRKFLALVPDDKFDWKPHEKSMSLKQLAVHLAEISGWPETMLSTTEIDFATTGYKPTPVGSTTELLAVFDENLEKGTNALANATEDLLNDTWTMKYGGHVLISGSKYEMTRHSFGQNIHHRAQLGVYLRLLNIAIPGVYGPSADENTSF